MSVGVIEKQPDKLWAIDDGGKAKHASLQLLDSCEMLTLRKKPDLFEVATGCHTNRHYSISNAQGYVLFNAVERSCWLWRKCSACLRCAYEVSVKMPSGGGTLLRLRSRSCACVCCACCVCAPCAPAIYVHGADGQPIGRVAQSAACPRTGYALCTEFGSPKRLQLAGPKQCCAYVTPGGLWHNMGCCPAACVKTDHYDVLGGDGSPLGSIRREDTHVVHIGFPHGCAVDMKAVILASAFRLEQAW